MAKTRIKSLGDCTYSSSKFEPMSKKPKKWIEVLHKLQTFLKKLIDNKQIVIARKNYCWSYFKLRHKFSSDCCTNKIKLFNAIKMEEIESSKSGKENA